MSHLLFHHKNPATDSRSITWPSCISVHLKSSVVIATVSMEAELSKGFLCVACVSHSGRTASHNYGPPSTEIHRKRHLLDINKTINKETNIRGLLHFQHSLRPVLTFRGGKQVGIHFFPPTQSQVRFTGKAPKRLKHMKTCFFFVVFFKCRIV